MNILLLVFLCLAINLVMAEPPEEKKEVVSGNHTEKETADAKEVGALEKCNDVMANNGLNFSSFWHGAAHGIHSICLEEIRHFFEPEALQQNRIPVVNANLSSDQTIIFNSPLRGYDEDFKTMAMKVMAYFMLNDKPDFFQQGTNTLEKLTHQYHMHEIYAAAAPIYNKMKEDPPTDPALCPCVNDVTANGILTEMVHIAKTLKYFARQPRARDAYYWFCGAFAYISESCSKPEVSKPKEVSRPASRPAIRPATTFSRGKRNAENETESITKLEKTYLLESTIENAENLLKVSPWHPNTLTGPDQWTSYEAMLTSSMPEEEEINDFAVFMFCKLNQPGLDHEKNLFE